MRMVTLQPREFRFPTQSPAPLLDTETRAGYVCGLDLRDVQVICEMVGAQLSSYGFHYARAGGRLWCAAEARVVSDVVGLELNLWEISAQIEEAKMLAQYEENSC